MTEIFEVTHSDATIGPAPIETVQMWVQLVARWGPTSSSRSSTCITLGMVFLAVGVYFLVLVPGETTRILGTTVAVANLHRLTIGETSSIVGASFSLPAFALARSAETGRIRAPTATSPSQ